MGELWEINSFAGVCGYFWNACYEEDICVNNGYNCKHPCQWEGEGNIGSCFPHSCPLVRHCSDIDDMKSIDPELAKEYEKEAKDWDGHIETDYVIVDESLVIPMYWGRTYMPPLLRHLYQNKGLFQ